MHRLIWACWIALFTLTGCSAPPARAPRHYIDLANGFEVDYPNGWQISKGRDDGEFVFAESTQPGATHCWVNAERINPLWMGNEQPTLDTFSIQLYLIKRQHEARNATFLSDHREPLSGYPARHFSARFDAPLSVVKHIGGPPRPVTRFQTEISVIYAKNRPFVLGCTARLTAARLLKDTIHMLRSSFRPMR